MNSDIVFEVFFDQRDHLVAEHGGGRDEDDRPEDLQTNAVRTADVRNAVRRRPAAEVAKDLGQTHDWLQLVDAGSVAGG